MVGTIVDYSSFNDIVHFIKILAGEKIYTLYPGKFLDDVKMDMDVEFWPDENNFVPLGLQPVNDYLLIDCGLIHQYAIKKENLKVIEDTTLYTVKIIKNLSEWHMKVYNGQMIFFINGEEISFKKLEDSNKLLSWIKIEV